MKAQIACTKQILRQRWPRTLDSFQVTCCSDIAKGLSPLGGTPLKGCHGEFPGGPVVKTLRFHCRGHGFNPWSGN